MTRTPTTHDPSADWAAFLGRCRDARDRVDVMLATFPRAKGVSWAMVEVDEARWRLARVIASVAAIVGRDPPAEPPGRQPVWGWIDEAGLPDLPDGRRRMLAKDARRIAAELRLLASLSRRTLPNSRAAAFSEVGRRFDQVADDLMSPLAFRCTTLALRPKGSTAMAIWREPGNTL